VSFRRAHFAGAIPCASSAAVKDAHFLKLQIKVLESELFCRFPVTVQAGPRVKAARGQGAWVTLAA